MIVPMLPSSNLFFPVGFVIAERILYLPRYLLGSRLRSHPITTNQIIQFRVLLTGGSRLQ